MPGTKFIAEVKDIYDLMDLYANLDKNADGKLGPNEVSEDEVKASDKGGASSATYNIPDGYLSPWEVAEMRGFKWEDVRSLRIANQTQQRTFNDIDYLPYDLTFGDYIFKVGTQLRFHKNGQVCEGVLAQKTVLTFSVSKFSFPMDIPERTRIVIDETGLIKEAYANRETKPFFSRLSAHSIIYLSQRWLSLDSSSSAISIPPDSEVTLNLLINKNLKVKLGTEMNYFGVIVHPGHEISLHIQPSPNNDLIIESSDGSFSFNEVNCKSATIRHGKVSEIVLATDTPSPYGSNLVHKAGTHLTVFKNGTLIEGSIACFRHHFPNIQLSGHFSYQELLLIQINLEKLPPNLFKSIQAIRMIKQFDDYIFSPYRNMTLDGRAISSPAGFGQRTIELIKNRFGALTPQILWHEAAHLYTAYLEEMLAKNIARATANISNPQEEMAIVRAFVLNSFKERWLRIASSIDGNVYGKGIEILKGDERISHWTIKDKYGYDEGPRNGFLHSYGCFSLDEDIGVFMASIGVESEATLQTLRQIMNPSSDFYRNYPNQRRYARVYRAKLELLREYGFITEEKYREIVPLHPDTAKFCATYAVNCP